MPRLAQGSSVAKSSAAAATREAPSSTFLLHSDCCFCGIAGTAGRRLVTRLYTFNLRRTRSLHFLLQCTFCIIPPAGHHCSILQVGAETVRRAARAATDRWGLLREVWSLITSRWKQDRAWIWARRWKEGGHAAGGHCDGPGGPACAADVERMAEVAVGRGPPAAGGTRNGRWRNG